MITLKEALTKSADEALASLRAELEEKAKSSGLNAYVGYETSGEGVPILIKDNIQVKNWPVTSASKILQGYIAPYEATAIKNLKSQKEWCLLEGPIWMNLPWAQRQRALFTVRLKNPHMVQIGYPAAPQEDRQLL